MNNFLPAEGSVIALWQLKVEETKAILRGVRLSAQKGRLVADQIRGLPVGKALDVLNFSPKKGAVIIRKVLLSAIAVQLIVGAIRELIKTGLA